MGTDGSIQQDCCIYSIVSLTSLHENQSEFAIEDNVGGREGAVKVRAMNTAPEKESLEILKTCEGVCFSEVIQVIAGNGISHYLTVVRPMFCRTAMAFSRRVSSSVRQRLRLPNILKVRLIISG